MVAIIRRMWHINFYKCVCKVAMSKVIGKIPVQASYDRS